MDIHAIYLRRKFWIDDYLSGSPIGKPYREIKFISEHLKSECDVLRERKLHEILAYAKKNCSFYGGVTSETLSTFPIMNKIKLKDNYEQIKVDVKVIPGQVGKVHIQTTSGSTGTPFAIPQDTMKRNRRIAELKYFGKVVGFNTHEKLIHLRTWNKWQSKTAKQIKTENIIPFDIADMGESRLQELCSLMSDSKAVCVRGYASSFDLLANYVKEHPMRFPYLKVCIAGSEALHDDVRAKVKDALHCEIISQYANEECGILAQERTPTKENGNAMYLNNASYYFEFLKTDSDEPAGYGELARIVVTDLHNHAFPMIRYDTGDVGVMGKPDAYSKGYPVLEKLYGRRLDVCYNIDGSPFSPMTIGRTLKHFDGILQWQFVQKDESQYVLKVVMKTSVNVEEYLRPAVGELKKVLGNSAILRIEKVDGIPVLASGKRKPVVNEWKNGK